MFYHQFNYNFANFHFIIQTFICDPLKKEAYGFYASNIFFINKIVFKKSVIGIPLCILLKKVSISVRTLFYLRKIQVAANLKVISLNYILFKVFLDFQKVLMTKNKNKF